MPPPNPSVSDAELLRAISELDHPPHPVRDISDATGLDAETARNRLVDLQYSGLVDSHQHRDRYEWWVTPEGQAFIER